MALSICPGLWGTSDFTDALPSMRMIRNALYVPFEGTPDWGVYDEHGTILAESVDFGLHGVTHLQSTASVDPMAVYSDAPEAEYIYYGRIHIHYGHFIINTLPRFWPLVAETGSLPRPLCHSPTLQDRRSIRDVLARLGLSSGDITIFDKPTRIAKLILPSTSLREQTSVHAIFGTLCRHVGQGLWAPEDVDRDPPVYLSKTRLREGVGRFEGELVLEDRLEREGVTVVHPQELSFADQVKLLSRSTLIMGTLGSALHTTAFAAPGRTVIALSPELEVNTNFTMIDRISGARSTYLYPAAMSHAPGTSFLGIHTLHDPVGVASEMMKYVPGRVDAGQEPAQTAQPSESEDALMMEAYEHRGDSYVNLLSRFHAYLEPKTYFEIGTLSGSTLALAKCTTIAVDPSFQLDVSATDFRPATLFFQKTSDRFFAEHDPTNLLGRPIDLAFLDGLHQAETLLRDFINTEKHCRRNSIITLHDCIPMNAAMTVRPFQDGLWTGDVWKIIPILKAYRPDVRMFNFDAGPTGLVCCTNLDPTSTLLQDRFFEIMKAWEDVELGQYGFDRLIAEAEIRWTETVKDRPSLTRYFWL